MARSPQRDHCLRCGRDVELVYEHSATMRRWWQAYFLVPIMLLPALPFLAGDFVVTLPLIMVYMVGMGPALSIVRSPPLCAVCGALIPRA